MSAAGHVGSAMALILGGIGGGITGQKNAAQEIIDTKIKQNIDAQVHNIQTKRSAIEDESNLVAQYMKNGFDISQAKAAAVNTQREMVKDQLLANAAGFAGQEAKNNAMLSIAKAQGAYAKTDSDFKTATLNRAATAQTMQFNALNEGYELQGRQALQQALAGGRADLSNPMLAPYVVTLPDGSKTIAARPEDAAKGREIVSSGLQYSNALQRVAEATKKASAFSLPGTQANANNKELEDALAQSKAVAHNYYKVKAGGKEGGGDEGGFGAEPKLLDTLAGSGPVNPLQKADTIARIKKHNDDLLEDMRDQLRANNVRVGPRVNKELRKPVGG
jgi:hypothetical protein